MLTTIKSFENTVNPLLENKIKCKSQIVLVEGNSLATDDKVLAKTFNNFLSMLLPLLESSMRSYLLIKRIAITNLMG